MTNALASTADDFDSGHKGCYPWWDYFNHQFCFSRGWPLCKGLEVHKERALGHCSCDYKFHMELVEMNDTVASEIPKWLKLVYHPLKCT